jgi:hypothetical protein
VRTLGHTARRTNKKPGAKPGSSFREEEAPRLVTTITEPMHLK